MNIVIKCVAVDLDLAMKTCICIGMHVQRFFKRFHQLKLIHHLNVNVLNVDSMKTNKVIEIRYTVQYMYMIPAMHVTAMSAGTETNFFAPPDSLSLKKDTSHAI